MQDKCSFIKLTNMVTKDLYAFRSYREYLNFRLPSAGQGRGTRAKLAQHLACQPSFISLVLSGRAHLNEDMAIATADFLNLLPEELEFYLLLFHYERAGTQRLRQHYQEKMNRVRQRRAEIHSRVETDSEVDFAKQMRFFSEWVYVAIMATVQISEYREERALAGKLHLSEDVIRRSTAWLLENGFLKRQKNGLYPTSQRVHLPSDSPFVDQHHRNWRNEAIRSLERKTDADLHYSGALSLSHADYSRLRELLLKTISDVEIILKPSADEDMVGVVFDLFRY